VTSKALARSNAANDLRACKVSGRERSALLGRRQRQLYLVCGPEADAAPIVDMLTLEEAH
jgi:hypothetical protein